MGKAKNTTTPGDTRRSLRLAKTPKPQTKDEKKTTAKKAVKAKKPKPENGTKTEEPKAEATETK